MDGWNLNTPHVMTGSYDEIPNKRNTQFHFAPDSPSSFRWRMPSYFVPDSHAFAHPNGKCHVSVSPSGTNDFAPSIQS